MTTSSQLAGMLLLCITLTLNVECTDSHSTNQPQKRGLIIGISAYQHYHNLNTGIDVKISQEILNNQEFDDAVVLENEMATHDEVVKTLNQLLEDAHPGDLVYIHYSGHGGQVTDNDNDETDGYDEVFILHDTPKLSGQDSCDESGSNCKTIRDDYLRAYLLALRKKLGPEGHVFMILDSCFSGTATRNPNPLTPQPRGLPVPFGEPANNPSERSPDKSRTSDLIEASTDESLASFVVISATSQYQLDQETRDDDLNPVGPLSLALARSMRKVKSDYTYNALFDFIKAEMRATSPNQHPQIEGDANRTVFGGRYKEETPYFNLLTILSDSTITLDGGYVEGLRVDTKIALHPPNTANLQTAGIPLATGRVIDAEIDTATVLLDRKLSDMLLANRAFVTSFGFGTTRLKVQLAPDLDPGTGVPLTSLLSSLSFVDVVASQADLVFAPYTSSDGVIPDIFGLLTGDGMFVLGPPVSKDDPSWPDKVKYRLTAFTNSKSLKETNLAGAISLSLKDARQTMNEQKNGTYTSDSTLSYRPATSSWQIKNNGCFNFVVTNNTSEDVFVTILDLPPNGKIEEVFPPPGMPKSEFLLKKNSSKTFEPEPVYCADIDEFNALSAAYQPYYEYKLFASTVEPIDFSNLIYYPKAENPALVSKDVKPVNPLQGTDVHPAASSRSAQKMYSHTTNLFVVP